MLTMRPHFWRINPYTAAREKLIVPYRLVSITARRIVFLHHSQRLITRNPGIIHEHREGTKALFDLGKHCLGAGKIRHVLLESYRFATQFLALPDTEYAAAS